MKRLEEVIKNIGAGSSPVDTPNNLPADSPARSVCPICGGLGYVREDVPVDHPNFGKLFLCRCQSVDAEQSRLERLRALSNLDHLDHMTFETFVPDGQGLSADKAANLRSAYDLARRYAEHPEGWLILFGGYGCGKTHLAAAIANQAIRRAQPVLFVVVPDLLDHLRSTFGPNSPATYDERFHEIRSAPLLILDDLGTQSSTPWAQEKLFQILNYRYNAHLPTVITSNLGLEEFDPRIRSRLVDPDLVTIFPFRAPDFRQSGVGQEQSDLSSLPWMQDMTFETFKPRRDEHMDPTSYSTLEVAVDLCLQFAREPFGWLVLAGPHGCGKTHLAAAIANSVVARGYTALFVVVPDLLDHLRATFSPTSPVSFDKRFVEVKSAPLLVLDDLGTENASPWAKEKLFQIFNYRYNARLPTVITMVRPLEEIDPRLRTRMEDRSRVRFHVISVPSYWSVDRPTNRDNGLHRARRSGR